MRPIYVMLVGTCALVVGLLLGAWVFTSEGWRGVAILCGVAIASAAGQVMGRRGTR